MLFNRILLCICFLFSFISYKSLSAPVSDGMCILLKQQVQQFSHAKQSRNYRQAKRAYDQGCYRAKVNKSTAKPVANNAKVIKPIAAEIKPVEVEPVEIIPVEVMPIEVVPVEVKPVEVKPVEVKPIAQEVKKSVPVISNPEMNNSLLDAYLIPILVLVGVLLFVVFFVFYIKPRAGKLKDNVEAIKSKAENIKAKQAAKKEKKEKLATKPTPKKRPVAKKRKKDDLDKDIYRSFKQLVLRLENNELVKVERITVSPYGIFVVESQTQSGGIFGGLNSDKWTSKTGDKTLEFDNPIKDAKQKSVALSKFLELKVEIQLVVLFDDETEFKAPMPAAVMNRNKLNTYIKSFKELVLSDDDFENYSQLIHDKVTEDWNKSQKHEQPEEPHNITQRISEEQVIKQPSKQNLSDKVISNPDIPEQKEATKPLSLEETLNELYKNEAHISTQHVEETIDNTSETNKTDNTEQEELTELPTQDEFLASLEMPELSNEKDTVETFENNEENETTPSESDSILAEIEQAKKELNSYLDESDSNHQSDIEALSDNIIDQLDSIAHGKNELLDADNDEADFNEAPPETVDNVNNSEVNDLNQADNTLNSYIEPEKDEINHLSNDLSQEEVLDVDIQSENDLKQADDVLASYLESDSEAAPEGISEFQHEVDIQSADDLKQADDVLASYLESDSEAAPEGISEFQHEVDIQSADDLKQADDALASYLESKLDDSNNLSSDLPHEDGLEVDIESSDSLDQADDALASYLGAELDDSNNLSNDLSHEDGLEVDIQSADDLKQADDALASYLDSDSEHVTEVNHEVDIQSADDLKQADDALASYLESELDDSNNLSSDLSHEEGLEVDIQSADDLKQADDALASYLESELDDSNNLSSDLSHEEGLEVDIQSADDLKQADDALASYLESELDDENSLSNGVQQQVSNEIDIQNADEIIQDEKLHEVGKGSDLFSNLSLDPTWAADSKEAPKNPTLANTDKSLKVENRSGGSGLSNMSLDESWDEKPKDQDKGAS